MMATAPSTHQYCDFANLGCFLPKSNSYKSSVFIITVKISLLTAGAERSLVGGGAAGCHAECRDRPTAAALSFSVFSLQMMVSLDSAIILEIFMSYFLQIKVNWTARTHSVSLLGKEGCGVCTSPQGKDLRKKSSDPSEIFQREAPALPYLF